MAKKNLQPPSKEIYQLVIFLQLVGGPVLGGGRRVQQLLEINLQQDPPLVAAGMPLLLGLKAQVKKCVQFFCSSFTV